MEQDIFVGVVAIATGLFVFFSAMLNSPWVARFWLTRHIENASNGSVSRLVLMAIGTLCVVLGTLLVLGFFPGENRKQGEIDSHDRWFTLERQT